MRSPLPKVLHPVAGRPMLSHVLDTAAQLAGSGGPGPVRTVIVVGHGAEQVRSTYSDRPDLQFVLQELQLGTGHAVQQSLPLLADGVPTLVLYGDVPLVRAATLRSLVEAAGTEVGVLTVRLPDPQGYGRVVRDWHGNVLRIVEQKDATEEERRIDEVNTGILVAPTAKLRDWLGRLSNDNAQREYYLTDIVARAVADRVRVRANGPMRALAPMRADSRKQKARISVPAPIVQSRTTLYGPTRTPSARWTLPSNTQPTSIDTSVPAVNVPRTSMRAGSASWTPDSSSAAALRAWAMRSSCASCVLLLTPSVSAGSSAITAHTRTRSATARATMSVR